jgi:hypothetical protein
MTDDSRTCPGCGTSLQGRRRDARYCSDRCRALASRFRRLANGTGAGKYTSLDQYLAARQSRARGVS